MFQDKPLNASIRCFLQHLLGLMSQYPFKQLGTPFTSIKKIDRIWDSVDKVTRVTFDLMSRICMIQHVMSDIFDRQAKGLPPRPNDFLYTVPFDFIKGGTSEENVQLWHTYVNHFKSWMFRASRNALVFDGRTEEMLSVQEIRESLQLLLEWEPKEENSWKSYSEGIILATLLASVSMQKYYLEKIFCASHAPLYPFITLLHRWVDWAGPKDHRWQEWIASIFSGMLCGIELAEKSYQSPLEQSLLQPLERVCNKFIDYLVSYRKYDTYNEPKGGFNLTAILNEYILWISMTGGREIRTCIRAKALFPSVDVSSVRPLALHCKKQSVRFLKKHPEFNGLEVAKEQILDPFDQLLALCP